MNTMIFVIGLAIARIYKYTTAPTDVQLGLLVFALCIGYLISIFDKERH